MTSQARDSFPVEFASVDAVFSGLDSERSLVLTDERLERLHSSSLGGLKRAVLPPGETAKSWSSLESLFKTMADMGVDRGWTLYAFGGGSVSDLGGFAASTWMRGIGFACLPTTLLAMVDASLGGKNGIDFFGTKNLIGTFRLPDRIICDIGLLESLDSVQFASGMAEAVKHAVIGGEAYFALLESCADKDHSLLRLDREKLTAIVAGSQAIKLSIVERDPREGGERRLLNLGHSFGHGIEMAAGLAHGQAVSLGMVLALALARKRGVLEAATEERIIRLLRGFGLPTDLGILREPGIRAKVADSLGGDKKRYGKTIHFVLPGGIGRVEALPLDIAYLKAFLDEESA